MNIAVVSYSYTGNNSLLAECVARDLSAKHIMITVEKPITMGSITMDMLFPRTPKVYPTPDILHQYDFILFFAPGWMGKIASPLRAYLRYLKSNPQPYGFLSISGGADGENLKLSGELMKRTGAKPVILLDQHTKDFIVANSSPTRKDTTEYKISETEANRLSDISTKEIKKVSMHG